MNVPNSPNRQPIFDKDNAYMHPTWVSWFDASTKKSNVSVEKNGSIGSYFDIAPLAAVPDKPSSGWRVFLVETGVTPAHRVFFGMIDKNGIIVTIYDVTN